MKLRFAPSPTGYLHLGNIRIALFNFLYAKKHSGSFILRIDDTGPDARREFEEAIREDLRWLGINWDEFYRQSERLNIYESFFKELKAKGVVYECFCTKEELEIERKIQLSRGEPPRYSGKCRSLTTTEKEKLKSQGRPYTWRFKVPENEVIEFVDLLRGRKTFNSSDFGDFIIRRADGSFLYIFTSSVDDGVMNITHIFRGEDHISNTVLQVMIMRTLGFDIPVFAHFPLLKSKEVLSKSENSIYTIRSLRNEGFLPEAIISYLFNLGRSSHMKEVMELKEMIPIFEPLDYGLSSVTIVYEQLKSFNKKAIMKKDNVELASLVEQFCGVENCSAQFCRIFKENVETLKDYCLFYEKVILGKFPPPPLAEDEKRLLLEFAASELDPFSFAEEKGIKKSSFFKLLRKTITGLKFGPPLLEVFKLLGPETIRERIYRIK